MGTLLTTRALTKLYGVVIGVNDVTLDLEPGVIGLLGPNGAGKSTLMKLITGQLRPTEGTIEVLGHQPWNNPAVFRELGFCPEQDAFFDGMSALQFVTALGRLSGLGSDATDRAADTLARVGAAEFMHRPIAEYSKGMRQRTKIAQALVHNPPFLVLDEPLTGTDPIGRRDIMDLVQQLGSEGKSILVSSHVLHEVQSMTDEFVLVFGGRILASGHVQEIRSLMNEFPHRITIRCDRPQALATRLVRDLPIQGVEISGDQHELAVLTKEPAAFYRGFGSAVLEERVTVHELTSADDNLQAVFDYLVSVR
ncbi:MAG: ABC transporter ATP-binding protein [Planctomycetota bacterium]